MTEYYIAIIIGIIQIVLSINLIFRRKNRVAIVCEIITSLILLFMLNSFGFDVGTVSLRYITLTVVEYLSVKMFLVVFFMLLRTISFCEIRRVYTEATKRINHDNVKVLSKLYKVKYWPKLKLGNPQMATRRHPITKVRFDWNGFPKFTSFCTVKLKREDWKKTREEHFCIANKLLRKKVISNYQFAKKFSTSDRLMILQGKLPNNYTWHHHQDAGVLQLVKTETHSKTPHIGGYYLWGSNK